MPAAFIYDSRYPADHAAGDLLPGVGLLTKWEFSTAEDGRTGKKKDALGVNSNTLSFS